MKPYLLADGRRIGVLGRSSQDVLIRYDSLTQGSLRNDPTARHALAQEIADALHVDVIDVYAPLAEALARRAAKRYPQQ